MRPSLRQKEENVKCTELTPSVPPTMLTSSWAYDTSGGGTNFFLYTFQGMRILGAPGTSGLFFSQTRIYSAALGRWISQDPAGYVDGTDLSQAFDSDPLSAVDSSGLTTSTWGPGGPPIHVNGHFPSFHGNWFFDFRAFHGEQSVNSTLLNVTGADADIQFWPDANTPCCNAIRIVQVTQTVMGDNWRVFGNEHPWLGGGGFGVDLLPNVPPGSTPAYIGGTPSVGLSTPTALKPAKITDQPSIPESWPGDATMNFYDLAVCDSGPSAGTILGAMSWQVNMHTYSMIDGFSSVIGPLPVTDLSIPMNAIDAWYASNGNARGNPYHL